MDTKPKALTSKEIKEITAMEDIQQKWGAESAADMEGMLETQVYADACVLSGIYMAPAPS